VGIAGIVTRFWPGPSVGWELTCSIEGLPQWVIDQALVVLSEAGQIISGPQEAADKTDTKSPAAAKLVSKQPKLTILTGC